MTAHVSIPSLDEAGDLPFLVRKALGYGRLIRNGQLIVELPDGRRVLLAGPEPGITAEIRLNDYAVGRRLLLGGDIGFAEAYIRGEWTSPDVTALLELFAHNIGAMQRLLPGAGPVAWLQRLRHALNRNSRKGARRNIHAHYDLGNRFYEAWLDESMTYSAALFEADEQDLAAAQKRKYRALADAIGLKPGDHVLEIGCGWGGFACLAAAEYGARVTGLTISEAQFAYATQRVAAAGLADKVSIRLCDYRDERGTYDAIVSIEMFEAVGERYWPAYYTTLRDRLKPGGRAGLQIITIDDRFWEQYRRESDFIRRYIFPGGMLPSPRRLGQLAQSFGFRAESERLLGSDYARTLAAWRERFRAAWPRLQPMGFDEPFRRLWEYYLHYCEAGFRAGTIDVRQIVLRAPG